MYRISAIQRLAEVKGEDWRVELRKINRRRRRKLGDKASLAEKNMAEAINSVGSDELKQRFALCKTCEHYNNGCIKLGCNCRSKYINTLRRGECPEGRFK